MVYGVNNEILKQDVLNICTSYIVLLIGKVLIRIKGSADKGEYGATAYQEAWYGRNVFNHSVLHHFQIITRGFLLNGLNNLFNKGLGYDRLFE